jgi:transposase
VKQKREEWVRRLATLDPSKRVFIDETWASTNMTRRYGRAPRHQRCAGHVPHGHWKTTTFIGGLRTGRIIAPMVVDGPMDGELFLAWVTQFLCPELHPGDIVVADNLGAHKVAGIETALGKVQARLLYLPPYSPDLNPIERLFSKLKALLRKAAKRTVDELWKEIGAVVQSVTAQQCRNFYGAAGIALT